MASQFKNVAYKSSQQSSLDTEDRGTLTVDGPNVTLAGKNGATQFPDIRDASIVAAPQTSVEPDTRDRSTWVRVDYGSDQTAFLGDFRFFGVLGNFGGNKRILRAIKSGCGFSES